MPAGIDVGWIGSAVTGRQYDAILILDRPLAGETIVEREVCEAHFKSLRSKLAPGKTGADIYWL